MLALQALYEEDVSGHPVDASLAWLWEKTDLQAPSSDYAVELMEGVILHRSEIDQLIHEFAPAWPVQQLAVIDRSILRLAIFEIRFVEGTPYKVAINEAVELAKTFGSETSARFVNGVLGSVMDHMDAVPGSAEEPAMIGTDNAGQGGK